MDKRRFLSRKALVAALAAVGLMVVTVPGVADVQVAHGYGMGSGMMSGYGPGVGMGPGVSGAPSAGVSRGYGNGGPGYGMGRGMAVGLGMGRGMMGEYGSGAGMGPESTQRSESVPGLMNYVLELFNELRAMGRAIQQEPPLKE